MMAELLGEETDRTEAESRLESIRGKFNATYWNGTEYRSPAYEGLTDDRGHALAVLTGLAEPTKYPEIREVFRKHQQASPYMEKYVLEALFQMGYPEDAIQRTKDRFGPMVESPLTTLWEGWGVGSKGFGGGSYNHAWSGGPLILLSQRVAGIAPLEPGYQRFAVRPQLGPLQHVKATVASVAGEIAVEIERKDDTFKLVLDVPAGTHAEVEIPSGYADDVRMNGVERECAMPQAAVVGEGHWEFKARRR